MPSTRLAVALAASGCVFTPPLFALPRTLAPATPRPAPAVASLRDAPFVQAVSEDASITSDLFGPSHSSVAAAGMVLVGIASARRCGRKAHSAQRAAAAAVELAEPAQADEPEKPPPPPPFDPSKQYGVTEPLGFFDPLGFCPPGDEAEFRQLRTAEIKHGRVAMMATLGAVVQPYVRIPGFEDAEPGIWAAIKDPSVWGSFALVLGAGVLEAIIWLEPEDTRLQPGDFGDPLGLASYDADTRNKELNNGRFAMFAAIGIVAAELYTGKNALQQFGLP
mmetsp:Transcript_103848/g.292909  ORF Transcript_103848/g.292909 Transcript_103848/m.292909 type:complete len:278 (-) Transcript_103848:188-1021(-)